MMRSILLAGALALVAGHPAARAQQSENPPAEPAPPAQPVTTQKEIDALLLETAKKEAAAAEQHAGSPDSVDSRPWAPPPPAPAAPHRTDHAKSQFQTANLTDKASEHYAAQWGIDSLKVAYTSSGNLLRFSYRVLDPARAAPLVDKKLTPYLYGPKSHALLTVPVMEKIGPLRQAMGQSAGQEYWMVFSNKGLPIKVGDRVNVTIGSFHADGLRVE